MADEQQIAELTAEDVAALQKQRAFIESFIADDESRAKYEKPAGKLGLLRALLAANAFGPDQTWELQSMGVVLGDAFVQELGLAWVMVEDEYGRDPAVSVPGTSTLLFPLTMISKRIEEGKSIDVFDLFNWAAAQLEELQ